MPRRSRDSLGKRAWTRPDFIGAAYHNGDPMTMAGNKLDSGRGYPSAMIDRAIVCDPYFGTDETGNDLGIETEWLRFKNVFSPFEIDVEADFTDDSHTAVNIDATVTSVKDIEGKEYRIEYVLIEDNMRGSTATWLQTNYYSGDESARAMEGMDMFIDAASHLFVPYNDVAVGDTGNLGVEGSLPENIEMDVAYRHSHTFELDRLLNYTGAPIVLDPNCLRVAVLVVELDGSPFGKVVNSAKARLKSLTAIDGVCDDSEVSDVRYYDLAGVQVAAPERGMFVKVTAYANGSQKTKKIVVR